MIDVWNRVLTNIKISLFDICKNVVNSKSGSFPDFPAVSVVQLDNSSTEDDFDNFENAVTSLIKIQSYSKKSLNEAREIINMACDAMNRMGYRRTYGPSEIKNIEDVNIKRMVARFERLIGDGDEIERFED